MTPSARTCAICQARRAHERLAAADRVVDELARDRSRIGGLALDDVADQRLRGLESRLEYGQRVVHRSREGDGCMHLWNGRSHGADCDGTGTYECHPRGHVRPSSELH